ncbi:hypothetical protein G7K_6048-t1 [Saitoella complicata NRRL Y-17804]|uniref:Ribosome biogenesis protein SLX9 n=1 Tax=Saitoella complicata (strain BCRC 22490 / CBS 7301 / JCM 7358 / NBRC 10748 / NRRL Y-17804) TaxID=698492 RepID=A0A0E9NRB6_SAICN|nr:hypothetical protein G7K_6048-t1 [Saitoella complicata NRRL Y-17804]
MPKAAKRKTLRSKAASLGPLAAATVLPTPSPFTAPQDLSISSLSGTEIIRDHLQDEHEFRPQLESKKDKRTARHEAWMQKFQSAGLSKASQKNAKRRERKRAEGGEGTALDMRGMMEEMAPEALEVKKEETGVGIRAPNPTAASKPKTAKKKKKEHEQERARFDAVMKLPAFKLGGLKAIRTHIQNEMAKDAPADQANKMDM